MTSYRRRNWLIGGAALLLTAGMFAWPRINRMMDVDFCYDSGGVYLFELDRCSYSQAEVDAYPASKRGSE